VEQRKLDEIEFHNNREQDRLGADSLEEFYEKYPNKSFYAINRRVAEARTSWMKKHCRDAVALDYCCGLGQASLELAEAGAFVHGIDISDGEIETAKKNAEAAGVADRTSFSVMDAEALEFPDDHFDVILCSGVLHHLDLDKAYPQLARVLKPTGQILCIEAQGTNPIINLYRRRTPHLRTSWEAQHILTLQQVNQGRTYFSGVEITFFHLFTILAIPFRRSRLFKPLLSILETVDRGVLKIPGVRRMAWQMIFVLRNPKRGVAPSLPIPLRGR